MRIRQGNKKKMERKERECSANKKLKSGYKIFENGYQVRNGQ